MKQNLLLLFCLLFTSSFFCATEKEKQVTLVQKTNNQIFLTKNNKLIGTLSACPEHDFKITDCNDDNCFVALSHNNHTLKVMPSVFKECLYKYNAMREYSLTIWLQEVTKTHNDLNLTLDYEGLMDSQENE